LTSVPHGSQHVKAWQNVLLWPSHRVNTLRTGDTNLRFYITTVQDG